LDATAAKTCAGSTTTAPPPQGVRSGSSRCSKMRFATHSAAAVGEHAGHRRELHARLGEQHASHGLRGMERPACWRVLPLLRGGGGSGAAAPRFGRSPEKLPTLQTALEPSERIVSSRRSPCRCTPRGRRFARRLSRTREVPGRLAVVAAAESAAAADVRRTSFFSTAACCCSKLASCSRVVTELAARTQRVSARVSSPTTAAAADGKSVAPGTVNSRRRVIAPPMGLSAGRSAAARAAVAASASAGGAAGSSGAASAAGRACGDDFSRAPAASGLSPAHSSMCRMDAAAARTGAGASSAAARAAATSAAESSAPMADLAAECRPRMAAEGRAARRRGTDEGAHRSGKARIGGPLEG